ncbi:MAG: hypothetical protein KAU89_04760 [Candidatus Thorarchaeota archaeon]|jgi:hypothetical protein|nr:hypothetical protein [Candidatus Thorarchaeota archaeon]
MDPSNTAYQVLQQPVFNGPFTSWSDFISFVLNITLALSIRGYLIFVLIGLMIYMTGLSDGLSKTLVIVGIALYLVSPFILGFLVEAAGVTPITLESATSAWLSLVGIADNELIAILVFLGDALMALCILIGAILYFTPTSNDLKARGQSLIVRALILAPVLVFFHLSPWL